MFELPNEPRVAVTPEIWNELLVEFLDIVRHTNPHRAVIIGPPDSNHLSSLDKLRLPASNRSIMVTLHYYVRSRSPIRARTGRPQVIRRAPGGTTTTAGAGFAGISRKSMPGQDSTTVRFFWVGSASSIWRTRDRGGSGPKPWPGRHSGMDFRGPTGISTEVLFGGYDRHTKQWLLPIQDALVPAVIDSADG